MRPRDAVYARIKRQILLNELPPETPLTELGIAVEMGCSQGTVREALLRLQEDGLVLRAGHRGTTVTPLDADVAVEILALRRRIETRGALRFASTDGKRLTQRLQVIQGQMEAAAAARDVFELIECDTEFHLEIFRLSGFRALEQILLRCILHTHRHKLWEPRHRRSLGETAARHRKIIAAIKSGGDTLATALGHHIDTIVDIEPDRIAS